MTDFAGRFVWYELMTTEPEAAEAFYRSVVGWDAAPFPGGPGGGYTVLSAGGRGTAGLMAIPPEAYQAGARPAWLGYLCVDDVDKAAARLRAAGGAVHLDARSIPGVGRIAMAADPQGAAFYLIAPEGAGEPTPPPGRAGSIDWHELHTTDWEAAFGFYADQFGWAKGEAMPMGPMGTYQLFHAGPGDPEAAGGMMNSPAFPRPAWLYYFHVDGIEQAVSRVEAGGGRVLQGPHEVPGGGWIIQGLDPQGAMFALVGPRR
ncbi:VOC family protein [Salinarimonas soli]|uniref:VOC family protein n=1 Tax=Salinarimonas soli TaxID=1638099 RepID=A0A5B2VW67_9HYPH|nr:VOC family protein [Salinarimonas soli]KAA2244063.1 VOC family protein [Salinarimonas soli]